MKTILITGASSGIGKDIAKIFASKNNNLVLVARRQNLLEDLQKELMQKHNIQVDYFVCDIAKNARAVYEYCESKNLKIDVLINNAGFGDYSNFIDADINKQLDMIDLNNKALVELTYYFVSKMKENAYGHIINVGSVASFVPGPYMAVYYASKSFVLSFSAALRQELKKYNIKVSTLCPGPTKSDFWKVANSDTSSSYDDVFSRSTLDAAKTCYRIYEKNKIYEIDGLIYKIGFSILRILPISISSKIVAYVQNKTKKKINS